MEICNKGEVILHLDPPKVRGGGGADLPAKKKEDSKIVENSSRLNLPNQLNT